MLDGKRVMTSGRDEGMKMDGMAVVKEGNGIESVSGEGEEGPLSTLWSE